MAACGLFPICQWYATQPYINIHARVRVRHQLPQSYLFLHSLLHASFWVLISGLTKKAKGKNPPVSIGLKELRAPGEELGFSKHEEAPNSCEKRSIRKKFRYFVFNIQERALQRVPKKSCSQYGRTCCGWLQGVHGKWS